MKKLSIVVPAYNEEQCVAQFSAAVFSLDIEEAIEIVFVDDGSVDGTLAEIKKLSGEDERVRYISFSRNFGKEAALFAGLKHSTGDVVVTMDADLQHDPHLLPQMLDSIKSEGYDAVAVRRVSRRGEPRLRGYFARRFYSLMSRYSDVDLKEGMMDFRMMTRQVVDAVVSLGESNRFSKGIYQWVGFRTKWIESENLERIASDSKWSLWTLFKYSMRGILAFSTAPLQLASVLGIVSTCCAFFYMAWVFVKWLAFGDPVAGWPTIICLVLLLGGLQLFVIGILGLYAAGIFSETKHRPIFIVRESK